MAIDKVQREIFYNLGACLPQPAFPRGQLNDEFLKAVLPHKTKLMLSDMKDNLRNIESYNVICKTDIVFTKHKISLSMYYHKICFVSKR